jgi:hypothetical protein
MPKSQEALGQYPNPKIPFEARGHVLVLFLFAVSYKKRVHQKYSGVNSLQELKSGLASSADRFSALRLTGIYSSFFSHVHSADFLLHPEQFSPFISLPHLLHGVHPQTWHIKFDM